MATGAPVPHDLVLPLRLATGLDTVPSLAFPPPNSRYWGCYGATAGQYGSRKVVDPEPGRCRRTDGKKWRCSREAFGESKYCEKHIHRGKNRSRKPVEPATASTINTTPSPYRPSPLSISPPAPADAPPAYAARHHQHQAPPLQLHLDAGAYRHAPSPPPSYHRYANHTPASVFTGGGYAAVREVQEAELRRQRCLALGADLSLDKPPAATAGEKPLRQFFDEWTGGGGVDDATQLSISMPTASPTDLAAARRHNGKPAC
ncbi:hypothetical protein PR202_ga17828 [Eleusine coracana subsp. coracana]|uniref:Growth-regulating factor n=1 Tax=Eleusine coracana subsp. coracana TaxID=191504 RepID=A0AAV5CQ24_ELECO|nr:hypothetical protein PR202_ga17828 [Eleusine coracana subsp. coracana]